jgi:hypothetical protein
MRPCFTREISAASIGQARDWLTRALGGVVSPPINFAVRLETPWQLRPEHCPHRATTRPGGPVARSARHVVVAAVQYYPP